jgi:hypothetical protein
LNSVRPSQDCGSYTIAHQFKLLHKSSIPTKLDEHGALIIY